MISTTHEACTHSIKVAVLITLVAVSIVTGEQIGIQLPALADGLQVQLDSRGMAEFSVEDKQWLGSMGEPRLPWRVVNIMLPPDAALETVSAALVDSCWEPIEGKWSVAPVPPSVAWEDNCQVVALSQDRPIVNGYDTTVYSTAAFWPREDVRLLGTGCLRQWRLAQVAVPMARYNPIQQLLTRLTGGQIVLSFQRSNPLAALVLPGGYAHLTNRMGEYQMQRLAVNSADAIPAYVDAAVRSVGDAQPLLNPALNPGYLIITTSAIQTTSTRLDDFILHQQAQGFDVSVITENQFGGGTGDAAAENIRRWLQNHYVTDNIEYVLLIGNPKPAPAVSERPFSIPMKNLYPRLASEAVPTDMYYADLTGNWNLDGDAYYGEYAGDMGSGGIDRFWEVIVGRIPYYGTVADLDLILQKIMDYQNQPASAVAWRRSAILPMRNPDDWTGAHWLGEQVKTDTLIPGAWGYHRVYGADVPVTPPAETTPCTMPNVTSVWKNGAFGLMLWWTHGSATSALDVMDTSYAAQLSDNHPSFTFQCSCNNAMPETTNNLCYTLLKKGAVCTIGDTRTSWYEQGQSSFNGSASNAGIAYEYVSRIVTDDMTAGHAIFDVTMVLSPSTREKWMNYCDFAIYGDPATYILPRCGRRYVNASASPGGDGTSWATAYQDLQSALDERATEIWVAAGIYRPDRGTASRAASFQMTSNMAMYGGFAGTESNRDLRDPAIHVTILSGDLAGNDGPGFSNNSENSYNVVTSRGCDARSVLDGFTITRGNASGSGPMQDRGGGVHNRAGSSPTISNCILTGNRAGYYGGALYNASFAASPTVTNCTFSGNNAASCGGGVANSSGSRARYTKCLFTLNTSPYAAAMDNSSDAAQIVNCDFLNNVATGGAGAVRCVASTATLVNCRFLGNSARTYGGAIYNESGSPTVINGIFSGNMATNIDGGAVYNSGSGNLRLTNCTITGNAAAGTYSNGGGLSAVGTTSTVSNCIFWNNRDKNGITEASQIYKSGGTLSLNYSCVQFCSGALGGAGNTGADPLLIDADGVDNLAGTTDDNLRVGAGSPCIDSGDNASVPGNITTDIESHPRLFDDPNQVDTGSGSPPIVDMGAYERTCPPGDFNCNNHVDWADLTIFTQCVTGPARAYDPEDLPAGCDVSPVGKIIPPDFDSDGDVDMNDFGVFQRCYSGAVKQADPGCAN